MRIRISRKEAEESGYWLGLLVTSDQQSRDQESLIRESRELLMILSAILRNAGG